jgi:hypothetical protein
LPVFALAQDSLGVRPFPNKLIYSETPEIGKKWHGGIRMNDLVVWDGYFNINGWLTADILFEMLNNRKFDSNTTLVTDRFSVLTLKSRPFSFSPKSNPYKLAGGIKLYRSSYLTRNKSDPTLNDSLNDNSLVLFITEGYALTNRHYFNLFTSISTRNIGRATYYVIPAYRFGFSRHWSFSLEYYVTNTIYLPIKLLQMAFSSNHWAIENFNQDLISFMFFGFQYSGVNLQIDFNLATHPSFEGPFIPILGAGWNF